MKTTTIVGIIVGLIVIGSLGYYFSYISTPGPLDSFATCLKDKGVKFFGAWWCPHCAAQKALFGKSAKLLPYVECQTQSRTQNKTCNDAGITGYPTWQFTDGTKQVGEMTLETLASKTGCMLPTTSTPSETVATSTTGGSSPVPVQTNQ